MPHVLRRGYKWSKKTDLIWVLIVIGEIETVFVLTTFSRSICIISLGGRYCPEKHLWHQRSKASLAGLSPSLLQATNFFHLLDLYNQLLYFTRNDCIIHSTTIIFPYSFNLVPSKEKNLTFSLLVFSFVFLSIYVNLHPRTDFQARWTSANAKVPSPAINSVFADIFACIKVPTLSKCTRNADCNSSESLWEIWQGEKNILQFPERCCCIEFITQSLGMQLLRAFLN